MIKTALLIVLLSFAARAQNPGPANDSPSQPAPSSSVANDAAQKDPSAQRAQQAFQQMVQALGGDAYLNLRDMEQQGRSSSFYHGQATGAVVPFWRFIKFPDKDRIELTKQRDWVLIYTGDQGYEITYRGSKPVEPKELKDYLQRREYSLDNILRVWLKDPRIAYFYEGRAFLENKQVDNVTLMNSKDESVTIAIDTASHLPIKKSFKLRDPESGEMDEDAEIYANYRMEDGFNTAHVITRLKNDEMVAERFLFKVTYNKGIDDSMFVPGAGKKKKK
ncbi:MAG TPA: hypothetical protein VFZ99_00570 [Terriglobales bacterium]